MAHTPPSTLGSAAPLAASWRPLQSIAKRALLAAFARLERGALRVHEDGGVREFGAPCADLPAPIELSVRDPAFWPAVALGGSMGGSDSYIRGEWRTSDLTGLIRLLSQNESVLGGFDGGARRARASGCAASATACAATTGAAAGRTSARTTTSATTSSRCSSIRR